MGEYIELFQKFDVNNIGSLIVISIVLIIIVASCIQPFYASRIEIILMSKGDELKRFSLMYVIFFFIFGLVNYMFVMDVSFIVLCSISVVLIFIIYCMLYILNKKGKVKALYLWCKDIIGLTMIIIIFPIFTFLASVVVDIKMISCVILGALVEIIMVALSYLNVGQINSSIVLNIENEKWYVFKRINDCYLLCGDKNNINSSTRTRLLELDYIIQEKLCFEKDVTKISIQNLKVMTPIR